jgi:hypothetical protein
LRCFVTRGAIWGAYGDGDARNNAPARLLHAIAWHLAGGRSAGAIDRRAEALCARSVLVSSSEKILNARAHAHTREALELGRSSLRDHPQAHFALTIPIFRLLATGREKSSSRPGSR